MERVFDKELARMSKNQLLVLKYLLLHPEAITTTSILAQKTGIVEKKLGGVLSAMSRKKIEGLALIAPMGRDARKGLRWKLNSKAITIPLAQKLVKALVLSYK